MSEQDIKRPIIDALNASGACEVWVTHSGRVKVKRGWMHLSPKGTPDITGFVCKGPRRGVMVGIEVKDPKGKTDNARARLQAAARERIRAAGGIAFEARSVAEAVATMLVQMREVRS